MPAKPLPVSFSDYVLRAICHMHWLPAQIPVRLMNRFRNPDKTPDRRFSVRFMGMTYKGSLASEIDRYVFFMGAYEPEMVRVLRGILGAMDAPVVADVGANVGFHSLFFSRFASRVHAFEPWATVRQQILERLGENHIGNVTVHGVALGDRNESRVYYAPAAGNFGTGSFVESHEPGRNQPSQALEIVVGDEYFQKNGIQTLDLLKVDVEGWDWFVLLGLAKTIQRCRPVIVFENSESTMESLRDRYQLDLFPEYELFLIGRYFERVSGDRLPGGNLLMIPAEKMALLRARPRSPKPAS